MIPTPAQLLAECMDYPWGYMPEAGREQMRKDALKIAEPLLKKQATRITALEAQLADAIDDAHREARELDRVNAKLADAQKDAWQPIETAPKDGTEILVLFRRIGVKCVAWTTRWNDPTDEHALWHIDDNKHEPYPLRGYNEEDELGWMPLPKEPAMQPKEQLI